MENLIEKSLFSARWMLAPIYLGLTASIALLVIKFFQEVIHVVPVIFEIKEIDLILVILSMIDIALVAGLLFIIVISSFESMVTKIKIDDESRKLPWMGALDVSSLKNKLGIALVSISSIHLLKTYMNATEIDNTKLIIITGMHLAFVLSAFIMGYLDRLKKR